MFMITRHTRSAGSIGTKQPQPLSRPSGDLLIFHTDRPSTGFAARPSGTEPKIKFYLFARTPVSAPDRLPDAKAETGRYLDAMAREPRELSRRRAECMRLCPRPYQPERASEGC